MPVRELGAVDRQRGRYVLAGSGQLLGGEEGIGEDRAGEDDADVRVAEGLAEDRQRPLGEFPGDGRLAPLELGAGVTDDEPGPGGDDPVEGDIDLEIIVEDDGPPPALADAGDDDGDDDPARG